MILYCNKEKWRHEVGGDLYHFYIDRWIYKGNFPTSDKAYRYIEINSHVFSVI
jgi:hypothetical protein